MQSFYLTPGALTFNLIKQLVSASHLLMLQPNCWEKIQASRQIVETILKKGTVVYGINTGFGLLASTRISEADLNKLQRNLLLSHAAGVGEPLPDAIVKLILLLKINSLALGFSGVRPQIIDMLLSFYNAGLYPIVPAKGSVGASGDLAPLAHLCLPLIGEGQVRYQNQIITAKEALAIINLNPIELTAKEGLALINGTQVSTALAIYYLLKSQSLFSAATVIGALTVEGAAGSDVPFSDNIQVIRNHPGQIKTAQLLREMMAGSPIREAHRNCDRVQDPYSLRCQPQVLGASLDNLNHVEKILVREANAVSDNPLVFEDGIISGGNFHAEPVAQAADIMAIALAEVGALSERRTALLIDPHFNGGLPAFLVKKAGIHSGFMIAHVTASALASANKSLAHPASVDSLPTSANQEDHVSMATYAAYRLGEIVDNVSGILAVELLAAAQAVDLRKPLETSTPLKVILKNLRKTIPFWAEDRIFATDIAFAKHQVDEIGETYHTALFDS